VADYGPAALRAFREATGIQDVPRTASAPHWFEFMEFNREQFRRYLRHYVAAVKRSRPKFQLCSNWAFSDFMPEPVSVPLDFLSGDYSPEDSVNSARLSARYLARQGKPWDLMAWSFTLAKGQDGSNQKTAVQLQREAAVVLALGGGFQAYFQQKRDGSIPDERMPVMAEVARFCAPARPSATMRNKFPRWHCSIPRLPITAKAGALFALERRTEWAEGCAAGPAGESVFRRDIERTPPDRPHERLPAHCGSGVRLLYPKFKSELVDYVAHGGNLLLIGRRPQPCSSRNWASRWKENPRRTNGRSWNGMAP